ncbi:MAG: hypothetical protein ACP5OA_03690 [Candidatus Woesearchaeota archaeon]
MKKYLLLIFFLLIPMVYANSIPYSKYNIYFDGKYLNNFTLTQVECWSSDFLSSVNRSGINVTSYNQDKDCYWVLENTSSVCKSNPCTLYSLHGSKLYLKMGSIPILTDEITETRYGQYDLFIHSDGSVELDYLKKINSSYAGTFFILALIIMLPFLLINTVLEMIIAYFYFKRKSVPYTNLWWVVLVNVITYIPFCLIIVQLRILEIILAEIIVLIVETLFYKLTIKNLQWNNVFILSLMTNAVTIAISIIVQSVLL